MTAALIVVLLPVQGAFAQPDAAKPARLLLVASACQEDGRDRALYEGLQQFRYVPGRNLTIDRVCYRQAGALGDVLRSGIARKPDVIVIGSPAGALVARTFTGQIPIICTSCGDPLDNGLVASLAHPGGNVTGLASLSAELIGKRFELMKEILPQATRIAAFVNPDNPGTRPTLAAFEAAKRRFSVDVVMPEFRSSADFPGAFEAAAQAKASLVLLQDDPFTYAGRGQIAELAKRYKLPTIAGLIEVAEAGGLISYGPDRNDLYRRGAAFVDKVLRGANPADLPIEQPSKFELVVNVATAGELQMELPNTVVLRADRIIK